MKKKRIEVTTHEAKTTLSELLRKVEQGGVVCIRRNDRPIAELRRINEHSKNLFSPHPTFSQVKFIEDPVLPVDAEDWPEDLR